MAILLTGIAEQLWEPFFPKYLQERFFERFTAAIWAVGIYSFLKNLVEGFLYLGGGTLSQRFGIRTSLLLFGAGPVAGYLLFLLGDTPVLVIAGTVMILSWEPLSVPGTFSVLGRRGKTAGFVLASIQKRLPKLLGPLLAGFVLAALGWLEGTRILVWTAFAASVASLVLQARLLEPGKPREAVRGLGSLWKTMRPRLKWLFAAEGFTRWGDWLIRDFVVMYVIVRLRQGPEVFGILVAVQMAVALLIYLPAGALAERGHRRTLIAVTFLFFALWPLALRIAGGMPLLVPAFVVYGLREIGEPVRKGAITILMPPERRAEGVGAYWGLRSLAFCPAPLVAAWVWTTWGPETLLWVAAGFCFVGLSIFVLSSRGLDAEIDSAGAASRGETQVSRGE